MPEATQGREEGERAALHPIRGHRGQAARPIYGDAAPGSRQVDGGYGQDAHDAVDAKFTRLRDPTRLGSVCVERKAKSRITNREFARRAPCVRRPRVRSRFQVFLVRQGKPSHLRMVLMVVRATGPPSTFWADVTEQSLQVCISARRA
jgi:hypothetical protein